ncbi:MAG TPA: lytic murein transglycosylase [Solirubrobacteraceae bacterium]|nr:lytic murein transglycosylase [Solirubrobacteraceae bacterium]
MIRRPFLTAAVAAALYATVLVGTASAQLHNVRVTLVTGKVLTMQVEVAEGATATASQIPGLPDPVQTVEDLGPVQVPTVVPTPQVPLPTATPQVPPLPIPTPSVDKPELPGTPGGGGGGGGGTPQTPETPVTPGGGDSGDGGQTTDPTAPAKGKQKRPGANTENLKRKVREKARDIAGGSAPDPENPGRNLDGTPTLNNPTFSLSEPGAAPIGVPNFFIDKFRIPPFLLSIYQAAGVQYGIRWEVLAAINEIETDYGRNLNISSAGAVGWMQFMPATWKMYGVDANRDGKKDPFNPVDAIFAAARYLRAAGADQDIRRAIFAYNHADWYVDSVLLRARVIGGIPSNLVGSLTGLTQGRFPVAAKATYADDISERDIKKLKGAGNKAVVVESGADRRGIKIFSRRGARVVAVNDGKVTAIGTSKRLGRFVKLQDVYGNTYTYAHLGRVSQRYPAPKPEKVSKREIKKELELPAADLPPSVEASGAEAPAARAPKRETARKAAPPVRKQAAGKPPAAAEAEKAGKAGKERLFANPRRKNAADAGGAQQEFQRTGRIDGISTFQGYLTRVYGLDRSDVRLKTLKKGSRVVAGTVLGRIGKTTRSAPHTLFEIRPAGRGAPRIDPKPILDGWKLLESTAIYRAAGKNPFFGSESGAPSIGQILLMSKESLVQRVVNNPRIQIYGCGQRDIQTGQIDRRVLATLEFLAASGFKPTVTSLRCGHSLMTASGNVSEHSTGNAVDIAAVNGIPIVGHQGPGSITELTIQRLLTLQGTMKPHQIISLMKFDNTDNTFAMGDHADHIHVGFHSLYGSNSKTAKQVNAILKPKQWIKLIDRLGEIDNPTVRRTPSRFSLDAKPPERASHAHQGE